MNPTDYETHLIEAEQQIANARQYTQGRRMYLLAAISELEKAAEECR